MSWNYRVIKRKFADEYRYAIHEAYYDDDGEIWSITKEPVEPQGETEKELADDVARYIKSLVRPVLDYDGPFIGKNPSDKGDED